VAVGFYLLDSAVRKKALSRAKTICADDEHVIGDTSSDLRWKP